MGNKNKGFTLVELIVVVAIIGIVAGLIGLSVYSVNSANARRSSESINTLISKCRADSLGRSGSVFLTISLDASGNIVCVHSDGTTVSTDTFPGNGISVSYTTKVSATETTNALTSSNPLTLSFDRSTGAQSNIPSCTAIIFTSSRTFTITLVPSTGNHTLI